MKKYRHIHTGEVYIKSVIGDYVNEKEISDGGVALAPIMKLIPEQIVESGKDWVEIKDDSRFEIIEITVGSGIIKKGSPDFDFVISHDHYASHPNNKYNHKIHAVRYINDNIIFRIGDTFSTSFLSATLATITNLEIKNNLLKITSTFVI